MLWLEIRRIHVLTLQLNLHGDAAVDGLWGVVLNFGSEFSVCSESPLAKTISHWDAKSWPKSKYRAYIADVA